jgi:hypothetical protein
MKKKLLALAAAVLSVLTGLAFLGWRRRLLATGAANQRVEAAKLEVKAAEAETVQHQALYAKAAEEAHAVRVETEQKVKVLDDRMESRKARIDSLLARFDKSGQSGSGG